MSQKPTKKDDKASKQREKNWTNDEIELLIGQWEGRYEALDKMSKNKLPLFQEISDFLKIKNYVRTAKQIGRKIADLKKIYRKAINPGTGSSPSNIPYIKNLHFLNQDLSIDLSQNVVSASSLTPSLSTTHASTIELSQNASSIRHTDSMPLELIQSSSKDDSLALELVQDSSKGSSEAIKLTEDLPENSTT